MQRLQERDVVERERVAVDGVADEGRAVAEAAVGLRLGEHVPVGGVVLILDLRGGGGDAEAEAALARRLRDRAHRRELDVGHGVAAAGDGDERERQDPQKRHAHQKTHAPLHVCWI